MRVSRAQRACLIGAHQCRNPGVARCPGKSLSDRTVLTMSSVQPTSLASLIDDTRDRNGWSDEDVARKARSLGHSLNKTEVSKYRKDGMSTLVPAKIKALADGLELPAWRVAAAALELHGIRIPLDGQTTEQAIRADKNIPATDREFLLVMLERAYGQEPPRPARRRRT